MAHKLKRGDRFMVFDNGPHLLCHVDAVLDTGDLRCWVENGCWEFIMTPATGHAAWACPGGSDQQIFQWMPLSLIPGIPKGDYNVVMAYVRSFGISPGRRMPLAVWGRMKAQSVLGFCRRVRQASSAFWGVMTGAVVVRAVEVSDDEEDDEIPF